MVGEILIALILGLLILVAFIAIIMLIRFYIGHRNDQLWSGSQLTPLKDVGSVKNLTILPLVDRKPSNPGLLGEPGVSYLIKADDTTILFDMGLNGKEEHPSPLLHNMETLGVSLEQVKIFVISHLHGDHVGGVSNQNRRTFGPTSQPLDLSHKTAFVPTPMSHPTAKIEVVENPRVIAPGVATLGAIPRQLFWFGRTLEQSLAINVKGKGIVLIIGCGHTTIQRIVQQAEKLFDQPIYGIVGGLHFPVTEMAYSRIAGSNNWPWNPISKKDVHKSVEFLLQRKPKVVSISPHDSCDWSIGTFREAFRETYQDLLVGKQISI
jgi:7,8-dihydropterin-6-yl-methyl-4-(beta-D-ribofuranosyl)aminobenzene 5'-phosphate synthase